LVAPGAQALPSSQTPLGLKFVATYNRLPKLLRQEGMRTHAAKARKTEGHQVEKCPERKHILKAL